MWLLLLLYAFFASTFTIGKEAVYHTPPLFFIAIRMTIAGILLLTFMWLKDRRSLIIKPSHYQWFMVITLFHIYFSYSLEFVGMCYVTAAKSCLLFSLSPFITAFFSYIYFKEVMTPKKWIGMIIGLLGFLPVIISGGAITENKLGSIGFISIPEIMIIGSVISASIGWIAMRKLSREYGYSYFFINGFGMLTGGILTFFTSYVLEIWPPLAHLSRGVFVWPLILLILIGNFLCYNLQGYLLRIYSVTLLSFFGFIAPLFAALFDWIWFGQSVGYSFFITLILVSLGLYLFYQEELRQGYIAH